MGAAGKSTTRAMRVKKVVKIAIIGAGHVGAATAFALMLKKLADEIVMIDVDERKAEGEALDLAHAALLGDHPNIYAGTMEDCCDAAIVIIAAGYAPQLDLKDTVLIEANLAIIKDVAPKIGLFAPRALLIVATHPNEAMTFAAARLSGLPDHRVIGYGTSLDTARFKYELAKQYGVDRRDISASIVGQQGVFELPLWSTITIDGLPIQSYCGQAGIDFNNDEVYACFWRARNAAFNIFEHKEHASFSMAAGIVAIVEAILRDEHTLMTVAVVGKYLGVEDIALSVPTRLSRAGALQMPGWSDDWSEEEALKSSAQDVKAQIALLNTPFPAKSVKAGVALKEAETAAKMVASTGTNGV
ncbi:hypothetical protein LTS10_008451 [Elasticomyces elasticus]|nr:hypothetical protein LTS10_008451 [Elasticomyces elasticus]